MPAKESKIERRIREDLRAIRQAAGFSQEAIADLFGWERAAVSKLETGYTAVRLADYLRIVEFCREAIPDHPAIPLAEFYHPRRGRDRNPYVTPAD